jgi:hypothetical protein
MKAMKKVVTFALPLLAVLLGAPTPSQASDHADGLKTTLDLAADLTDLFTFTSPKNPDKLVMIMNVHGLANSTSRFSNAVDYKFRIRPIDDAKTLVPSSDPAKEQSIVCSFTGGIAFIDGKQHATCIFNLGPSRAPERISFETRASNYSAGGSSPEQGIARVFAGVRSDPWFLDLGKTVAFDKGQHIQKAGGSNGLHGHNILSIAVEIDKSKLNGPLLAVTAQTVRK